MGPSKTIVVPADAAPGHIANDTEAILDNFFDAILVRKNASSWRISFKNESALPRQARDKHKEALN